jgi:hypothetical protein
VADRVTFTKGSAERIAQVVRIVEAGNRDTGGLPTSPRFGGGGGKVFRVCTFTGSWNINETKTLTFQGVTTTPNTVVATNQLFTIGDACTSQVAYIGKVKSTEPSGAVADWHLLNVQHHETAVVVNVTLTTAALEFTRRLVWTPYPGETSTLSIALITDTACSS